MYIEFIGMEAECSRQNSTFIIHLFSQSAQLFKIIFKEFTPPKWNWTIEHPKPQNRRADGLPV
jgi:hypothetical protein